MATVATRRKNNDVSRTAKIDLTPTGLLMEGRYTQNPAEGEPHPAHFARQFPLSSATSIPDQSTADRPDGPAGCRRKGRNGRGLAQSICYLFAPAAASYARRGASSKAFAMEWSIAVGAAVRGPFVRPAGATGTSKCIGAGKSRLESKCLTHCRAIS